MTAEAEKPICMDELEKRERRPYNAMRALELLANLERELLDLQETERLFADLRVAVEELMWVVDGVVGNDGPETFVTRAVSKVGLALRDIRVREEMWKKEGPRP